MDTLSPAERSERMSRVRNKDTKPEWIVRKALTRLGFRYRLQGKAPGRPDIVFKGRRKAIFVHGCFWHQHPGCGRKPKSRLEFWLPKLEANRKRDLENERKLREQGWTYLVIWECELKDVAALESRLKSFLGGDA